MKASGPRLRNSGCGTCRAPCKHASPRITGCHSPGRQTAGRTSSAAAAVHKRAGGQLRSGAEKLQRACLFLSGLLNTRHRDGLAHHNVHWHLEEGTGKGDTGKGGTNKKKGEIQCICIGTLMARRSRLFLQGPGVRQVWRMGQARLGCQPPCMMPTCFGMKEPHQPQMSMGTASNGLGSKGLVRGIRGAVWAGRKRRQYSQGCQKHRERQAQEACAPYPIRRTKEAHCARGICGRGEGTGGRSWRALSTACGSHGAAPNHTAARQEPAAVPSTSKRSYCL